MKNSPFTAMSAVIISLVGTTVLLCQTSVEQTSMRLGDSLRLGGSSQPLGDRPDSTLDPPDEIIEDLAGHSWSQLESSIRKSSAENDTLVVWIVDESSSMSQRRSEIANRIERAFGSKQNDLTNQLSHSLFSFGQGFHRPTEDWECDAENIASQFRNVVKDDSGKEMTMTAVRLAADQLRKKWQTYKGWNRMFVVVTDERGDDYEVVEEVANLCSRMSIRVFCLGNASPFGTEKGLIRYTYEDGFQVDIPVDQGPETVAHQTLRLPQIGRSVARKSYLSSGFGPYALEWLCRETGGQFYIYEDCASQRFSARLMDNYRPDYISPRKLLNELPSNQAKMALINAARSSRESTPRIRPIITRGEVHRVLRMELTERQKECAIADQFVQKLMTMLKTGLEHREGLNSLRWRASFELAWGQALAARVRLGSLNFRLAQMKVEPQEFNDPENNTWTLVETSELHDISGRFAQLALESQQTLKRVVTDHPGTPFAHIARLELDRGFGWKWLESRADGPALTSRERSDLEWQYRWGGRPEFLKPPLLVPRKRPPSL